MRQYQVIVNPIASKGAAGQAIPQVKKALQEAGVAYELAETKHPWHAAELTEEAITTGHDTIIAVGGDGTINEVINGIMMSGHSGLGNAVLGVIPIGRGNDFAFGAGIPTEFDAAIQTISARKTRKVDVGRITGGLYPTGRYFGNGVGIGFDAAVSFLANQSKITGFVGYLVAALKTIYLYYQAPTLQISLAKETITLESLMVSVMNGRRMGGGFYMAPDGDPYDGKFDLCIAGTLGKTGILMLLPRFLKGTQSGHKVIQFRRDGNVTVRAVKGTMPVHADGEAIAFQAETIKIELIKQGLEIITP